MKNWNNQRTISQEAEYSGIGIHTGAMVHIRLLPAPVDSGITFVRTDTAEALSIPLKVKHVEQKPMCTMIKANDVYVETVEHLLSAVQAFGINNLEIEINSIEPPGADGSAKEFCNLIMNAGIEELNAPRRKFVVEDPIYFNEGDSSIVALPNPQGGFRVSYTLEYDNSFVERQHFMFDLTTENYITEISAARTFCFEHEAEALRQAGFGKGASTRNTCVITEAGLLDNELRYPDEFVRHKILDLIGDLSALGIDLHAHVVAIKTGHKHNFQLARLVEQAMKNELKAAR